MLLPATGLATGVPYLIAAYILDDVMALRAVPLAAGHMTSPGLGIEVLANNPRETLVGMVQLTASRFTPRLLLSWHNRRNRTLSASFTAERSTGTLYPTWVEVNAEIGIPFLTWADELDAHLHYGIAA